jgi:hypothetical protein
MKKLKDFILYFGWFLGFETFCADLGFVSSSSSLLSKYLTPLVFAALFTFLIIPLRQLKKPEKKLSDL